MSRRHPPRQQPMPGTLARAVPPRPVGSGEEEAKLARDALGIRALPSHRVGRVARGGMIETLELDALRARDGPRERLDRVAQERGTLAPAQQEHLRRDAGQAPQTPPRL